MQPYDIMPTPQSREPLDYWREHRIEAMVWPQSWSKVPEGYQFEWTKIRFTDENKASVSPERGIYAFAASVENWFVPPHGYILYIGITGARKPRGLQVRYDDYLRERRRGSKRPRIRQMFKLWGDHLDFWFAPCPDTSIDLEALEKEMNTMVIPPFVEMDFEDWARPMVKLLRTN